MKSEPKTFSLQDLKKAQKTGWDGVRNYQARNFMRDQMRLKDKVLFYHSNAKPSGVAGLAEVCKESHPDPTQFLKKSEYYDPRANKEKPIWFMVEVRFLKAFPHFISLDDLRKEKALKDFSLLKRGNRLSILPVSPKHWKHIMLMVG